MKTGPKPQRRFPLAPLMSILEQRFPEPPQWQLSGDALTRCARTMGFGVRTAVRWRSEGALPMYAADRMACMLGYHPASIWPDWFEEENYAKAV